MILHLLVSVALADPVTAAVPWGGIPLDGVEALGLGEPSTSIVAGEWRAPLLGGGFVRVMVLPDEAAAHEVFVAQRASSSTRPPADRVEAEGVEAAGDDSFRIARDRNVVLVVRDHQDAAGAVVERLRGALVTTGCEGIWRTEQVGDEAWTWNRCGVRMGDAPDGR